MVSHVPEGIVELLSGVPRIVLSSEFEQHTTEWKKLEAKGRILTTAKLLLSKINVDNSCVRCSLLVFSSLSPSVP